MAEAGGRPVGWVHPYIVTLLEAEQFVEIGGLVVDQDDRGQGVGRALMAAAEAWTRQHGLDTVSLRSNAMRTAAHRFYADLGYTVIKQQLAFTKRLGPEPAAPESPVPPDRP